MKSQNSLRCLMVGMGTISRIMHKSLSQKPWFGYAGAVDVSDAGLAAGKELTGLPDAAMFKDLGRALSEIKPDIVIINTPSEWHYAQTCACLEAGCQVLVAKPITNDYAQAAELVRLAEARGVTLCVIQQVRYNRHYKAVAKFVQEGNLGQISCAWFMNSKPRPNPANLVKMGQPALYEMACHHFDSLAAVFGEPSPEWIVCDGFRPSWSKYAGPCMVNAMIGYSGGLHVSYHGGFSSQAAMYEFRLEGAKGALRCRGLHMSNDTMDYEFAPAQGKFSALRIDDGVQPYDPFGPFLDVWYDYRQDGAEPPFSGRNNLKVFAVLSAAIESVEKGKRVQIAGNPRFADAFAISKKEAI